MAQQRGVQITGVTAAQYAALSEYLRDFHDLSIVGSEVTGRGVHGSMSHDAASGALEITIHAHPSVVTPGYLIGFIYDQLGTVDPAKCQG